MTTFVPPAKPDNNTPLERNPGSNVGMSGAAQLHADNVLLGAQQGHGIAAERANHMVDYAAGHDAQHIGGDNAKNGADRIVDGYAIQTKYCKAPQDTIANCFKDGRYRYLDHKTPMQVEVPSDQYEAAVELMVKKFENGQLPELKSVDEARSLVKRGNFTYKQARNMTRFGTIESLSYDAATGAIVAASAMGISAALTFATAIIHGKDWAEALDVACFNGLSVGGTAWLSSIMASQAGHAGADQLLRTGGDWFAKQFSDKMVKQLAEALGKQGAENLSTEAARRHVSKVVRGHVVAAVAATLVLSTDDFLKLFSGRISGAQAAKNIGSMYFTNPTPINMGLACLDR